VVHSFASLSLLELKKRRAARGMLRHAPDEFQIAAISSYNHRRFSPEPRNESLISEFTNEKDFP
jgi:hypothetical protein